MGVYIRNRWAKVAYYKIGIGVKPNLKKKLGVG